MILLWAFNNSINYIVTFGIDGYKAKEVYSWLAPGEVFPTVAYRALIRYSARLMLAGDPVIVTWRSVDPSTGLAILIWAPDIWRISLIFDPWRPIMQPISYDREEEEQQSDSVSGFQGQQVIITSRVLTLTFYFIVPWGKFFFTSRYICVALGRANGWFSTLKFQSANIFNVVLVPADLSKCIQSDDSFVLRC